MIPITTDAGKGFRVIYGDGRNNVFCVAKIYEKSVPAVASNIPLAQITFSQLFLRVHQPRDDVIYGWTVGELSYRFAEAEIPLKWIYAFRYICSEIKQKQINVTTDLTQFLMFIATITEQNRTSVNCTWQI